MEEEPATPSSNVSGDSDASMDTLLAYRDMNQSDNDSDEDGFQHV